MIAKAYLLVVALLYFALAIWCSTSPATTSENVSLSLKGGTGKSEFLTVYGGLEFGIALVLAAACLRDATVNYGLLACILLHGSLVLFRTISFFMFDDIGGFTVRLAIGEWLITVVGIAVLLFAPIKS